MQINFYSEDIDFELANPLSTEKWLKKVIKEEKKHLGELTYIFCNDEYLHKMNVEHLQHDTLTDVITFQYSEELVEGDIFISVERTNENAVNFGVEPLHELNRVMVHGLLHLLGYDDKTGEDKEEMTAMENKYLLLLDK